MNREDFKELNDSDLKTLARRHIRSLEEQLFTIQFDLDINEDQEIKESEQTRQTKNKINVIKKGLALARTKYNDILNPPEKPEQAVEPTATPTPTD